MSKHTDNSVKFPFLVHYYWIKSGENTDFTLQAHGNAKSSKPYIQTKRSVLSIAKAKLATATPAKVYPATFDDAGGMDSEHFLNVST